MEEKTTTTTKVLFVRWLAFIDNIKRYHTWKDENGGCKTNSLKTLDSNAMKLLTLYPYEITSVIILLSMYEICECKCESASP